MDEALGAPAFSFLAVCIDARGHVQWAERVHNLVMIGGKNDVINQYFIGAAYSAAWFMGLKGIGTIVPSDTLASKAWAEVTPYTGARKTIAFGTTSAGSNAPSTLIFNMTSGPVTVAGVFVAAANSGTSAVLYSASDFASPHSVNSGDTLTINPTVSAA